MSISTILSTAVTGLVSNSARVATRAENIANLNTDGYLAKEVQTGFGGQAFTSTAFGSGSVHVEAIEPSNVNLAKEFIDIIAAKAAYEASARVFSTAEEMHRDVLDIKA
jgi:flagellar hook protein FlgE